MVFKKQNKTHKHKKQFMVTTGNSGRGDKLGLWD